MCRRHTHAGHHENSSASPHAPTYRSCPPIQGAVLFFSLAFKHGGVTAALMLHHLTFMIRVRYIEGQHVHLCTAPVGGFHHVGFLVWLLRL